MKAEFLEKSAKHVCVGDHLFLFPSMRLLRVTQVATDETHARIHWTDDANGESSCQDIPGTRVLKVVVGGHEEVIAYREKREQERATAGIL